MAARLLPLALTAAVVCTRPAPADVLVVTRAMTAPTVAEVFVEEDAVRVELEVGGADLLAFADLLPDEAREQLELPAEPLEERLARFAREGWVVRPDGGEPVPCRLESLVARRRIVRDEITGEPLPPRGDEEPVVFLKLAYPLEGRPASLTLSPPGAANVGFVLYHGGLPVTDFRYLAQEETAHLDWEDPWYSRFDNRNLRRRFDASLAAYLYVEPFEVRKEVVVRPRDLQPFVDLGLEGSDVIPAAAWGTVQQRVADFLMERCPVTIDGREVEPVLDRVNFLRRTLRATQVIEPPQDLPLVSATLGVIISYPLSELPQEVSLEWELFGERFERVPSAATDEAGGLPTLLTPEDPVLVWHNFLTNPTVPGVVALAPPEPARVSLPLASLAAAALAVALVALRRRRPLPRWRPITAALLAVVAVLLWPHARVEARNPLGGDATPGPEEASGLLTGLLRNVYRAFDFRTESDIYDTLGYSASGELLTDVYLEVQRALELENQGGARAKVQDVEVESVETTPLADGAGFRALCTWNVTGSVGHWGHLHKRRNRYEAELVVEPVEGAWKITGLDLLAEQRL